MAPLLLFPPALFVASAARCAPRFLRPTLLQSSPSFFRRDSPQRCTWSMDKTTLPSFKRKEATKQLCVVSGYSTELLKLHPEEPSLHILFIPGNPGVVSYYKDFVETLYEQLEGQASITAIGHISQTVKDWEHRRLFSLQEQINHKVDFIKQELQNSEHSIILVGHSIGSYICLEVFKRLQQQVKYFIGLYPFLTLNRGSAEQARIRKVTRSSFLSAAISSFSSFLGLLPKRVSRPFIRRYIGPSCSSTAVDVTCSYLLQYHTMRNVLFMAKTEFTKLSEEPDWTFMRGKQKQIAFLFGINDHWGPLPHLEEISRQVPGLLLSVEREGHMHAFCCTDAGSIWVAHHVANQIKDQVCN